MPEPLRILLLEDSVAEAEMITSVLRRAGLDFRSRLAGDRASFSLAIEVFQPHVVLAGSSLTHFRAIDALKMIREQLLHIAFILTGTVSDENARDVIRMGADNYILKDKMNRLPAAIEAAVREKQTEKEKFEARQQLVQSEERFRTLIERISDGFIALDKNWRYVYVNRKISEMTHRDPQSLIGKNIWEEFPNAVGTETYNAFHKAMREQQYMINVDYFEPLDLWQENHIYPSPEGLSVFIRDITHRKRAEQELQLSEMRLREAQAITHLSHWEIDLETNVYTLSDELYRILGFRKGGVVPSRGLFLSIIHPDDLERVKKQLFDSYYLHFTSLTYRFIRRDGAVRHANIEWKVNYDEQGKPRRLYGIFQDVTKQKEAEIELQNTNEELRNLSSHLQNVREEERIHIAREIHDELGQQLTGLKMNISLLQRKLPMEDLLKEKLAGVIDQIDETVKSVRRISTSLRPSILDDLGLIAALEWHSREVEKRSEIVVNFNADLQEPELPLATATGIFRIYQEILTNAVRHSNAHEINSSLVHNDGHLVLKVEDDGQGMDLSLAKTKKTLGLLGIKERTFLLGGRFDLQSAPGQGTIISIWIPVPAEQ